MNKVSNDVINLKKKKKKKMNYHLINLTNLKYFFLELNVILIKRIKHFNLLYICIFFIESTGKDIGDNILATE